MCSFLNWPRSKQQICSSETWDASVTCKKSHTNLSLWNRLNFSALVTELSSYYAKKNLEMKNSIYCIFIILHHTLTLNSYKACPISYLHYLTLKKIGKRVPLWRNIFLIQVLWSCGNPQTFAFVRKLMLSASRPISSVRWRHGSTVFKLHAYCTEIFTNNGNI